MSAKFELKNNTQTIFKKKRNVPFASLEKINEELDRLVKKIGNMVYIIHDPKVTHKRYIKQIRKHQLDDPNYAPHKKKKPLRQYRTPSTSNHHKQLQNNIDTKRRKKYLYPFRSKGLGGGVYGDLPIH